jgi:hypothetical protein
MCSARSESPHFAEAWKIGRIKTIPKIKKKRRFYVDESPGKRPEFPRDQSFRRNKQKRKNRESEIMTAG